MSEAKTSMSEAKTSMSQVNESDASAVSKTVLPTGLTVLSQTLSDRRTLSLGVWVRSGSRDEPQPLLGVTHFLEHMMF